MNSTFTFCIGSFQLLAYLLRFDLRITTRDESPMIAATAISVGKLTTFCAKFFYIL
ncbi:MAG: hypothetical protein KAJ76_00480 [Candidatus Heimdallarchaeota archaeon]|nr:hypothetical protein [Candidatus Heimdallarchaeota archaeon]